MARSYLRKWCGVKLSRGKQHRPSAKRQEHRIRTYRIRRRYAVIHLRLRYAVIRLRLRYAVIRLRLRYAVTSKQASEQANRGNKRKEQKLAFLLFNIWYTQRDLNP